MNKHKPALCHNRNRASYRNYRLYLELGFYNHRLSGSTISSPQKKILLSYKRAGFEMQETG
jgi:hypothetical protein